MIVRSLVRLANASDRAGVALLNLAHALRLQAMRAGIGGPSRLTDR
jgi:hypothetical protein